MSGPKLKPTSRMSQRPTWFQDVKSGCEKQTDYFLRIRKLQKELINREEHNLVNAMERLKQLQYPRRKPFIRNFDVSSASSKCFPTRPLNIRRDPRRRLDQRTDYEEITPLKGKLLFPNKTDVDDEANLESFTLEEITRIYSMLPILNDRQIAKIVHDVRTTFPNEPSTYLLQPHLPCIPNVARKANKRLDNRLRLLTLTDNSCGNGSPSNVQQIHFPSNSYSQRQRKPVSPHKAATEKQKPKNCARRKGKKNILDFDVDPNDSLLFANCLCSPDKDDMNEDSSPLPPPNSRPTSCQKNDVNASDFEAKESQKKELSDVKNDQILLNILNQKKTDVEKDETKTSAVELFGSDEPTLEKEETGFV